MKTKQQNDETTKTEKAEKSTRQEWQGLGMCEFIRYGGSQGWESKLIGKVAEVIGFKPGPSTLYIQSKKGRDGENVPTVEKAVANELKAHYESEKQRVEEKHPRPLKEVESAEELEAKDQPAEKVKPAAKKPKGRKQSKE